jgi:repressor LexA
VAHLVTRRQRAVVTAIRDLLSENEYSPSVRQIGDRLGLAPATIQQHLDALERKGTIARTGAAFGIEILEPDPVPAFPGGDGRAPLVGAIAAGEPILAVEDHQETIHLPDNMRDAGEQFVLRVQGDSMIEDHILDGDLVVIHRQQSADDGETVVALLEDGTATLKRIYREGGRIRLQPANSTMDPIIVDAVDVQGKVTGIIRPHV